MTLHQLRIFATVAKHLNITKASAELHITQPSVSQQLKFLEGECRVKLYKKLSRGIELTERGQLFLTDTVPLLLQVERLKEKFKDSHTDGQVGSLTIGGSHSQSVSFLPMLLAVFKETHPHVELTLRTDSSRALEQLVLNSEVEIAVITNPSNSSALNYELCRQESFVAFVSVTHPLAKKQQLTLAELAQAPLVFRKGKDNHTRVSEVLKEVKRRGFKLNIVMRCDSTESLKAAVKAGMGLGILYQDHVDQDAMRGELKKINIPELKMKLPSFIVYPKGISLAPNGQDFLTLLREWPKKTRGVKGSLRVA